MVNVFAFISYFVTFLFWVPSQWAPTEGAPCDSGELEGTQLQAEEHRRLLEARRETLTNKRQLVRMNGRYGVLSQPGGMRIGLPG